MNPAISKDGNKTHPTGVQGSLFSDIELSGFLNSASNVLLWLESGQQHLFQDGIAASLDGSAIGLKYYTQN
jgi:hypothetical protein